VRTVAGTIGLIGGLSCAGSMLAAVAGAAGVGTAAATGSMAAMNPPRGGGHSYGLLSFLLSAGPTILAISIGLVTISFGLRSRAAALPAALAGAGLYWAMYVQSSVTVMDAAIGVGLGLWILGYVLVWRVLSSRRVVAPRRADP